MHFVIPITDNVCITHYFELFGSSLVRAVGRSMDAKDFREKAATCLKLAQGLSWKNPSRFRLMDNGREFSKARYRT
jgi:hypothetical protein